MNISGRLRRNADQSGTHPINVGWPDVDGLPQRKLSQLGMEWSERTGSNDTTRLEGGRSWTVDFYPSFSRTAARIGEFQGDSDGARGGEQPKEESYGLDPTAIFKKVTQAENKKRAPEQNITLFALRLAIIEKAASGIGTLSFIWASTIILGGFASDINPVDFIVIALILATEGTRIFSRSRELEWQHLSSKSTDSLSSKYKSERLHVVENCGIKDLTKNVGVSVATEELPAPSSEPQGPKNLSTKFSSRFSYGSNTRNSLEVDLENEKRAERAPYLASPIGKPSVDRTKTKELDEVESIVDVKPGQGMYRQPSISTFQHASRWKSTMYNNTPEILSEKFPTDVLGEVDAKNIKKTWSADLGPILPVGSRSIVSTRGVSAVLYWIQLSSAIICLALACWRLARQEYNPPAVLKENTPVNLYTSLNIFYGLAVTEALLFLLERAYCKVNYEQLVLQVSNKADLGGENQEMMQQFFYEVYKKCIDGSVFDGLAMDVVEYSLSLIQSDSSFEQLGGLRVLRKIVDRYDGFSLDALRRIGAAPGVTERLVEMLSWRGTRQEDIRLEVAALICRMVRYNKNSFRVAAVPGAMEGIVSLLRPYDTDRQFDKSTDLLALERTILLRLDGLRILVAQARDPVNVIKIGETRGLIPILVSFITVTDVQAFREMEGTELKTFKKVLRLIKMLAAARNTTAAILRPVIVRVVFGIASMRDILEFGDCHPQLQWMAIEILNNLTLDDEIRRAIGSTGGVIRNLFTLYSRNRSNLGSNISKTLFVTEKDKKAEKAVSKRAGDALNLLATMSRKNCLRMMDLQDGNGRKIFIPSLINLLNEYREHTICAAKILRSLMEYGNYFQKREIEACSVRVMDLVMGSSSQRMHEAVVGLAPRVLAVLDGPTYEKAFENVDRTALVQRLLRNLEYNARAASKFPRLRRHSIELVMTLVRTDPVFLEEFMRDGLLERKLMQTLDSICEAEDYIIFSGAEGLTRHSITMEDLVQQSLQEVRILDKEREFPKLKSFQTSC